MATMTGLLAMAVVGVGPAPDPCDEAISVQVRMLDMEGLDWRSDAYARLRPVTTRGTTSVWTADRDLVNDLIARAKGVATAPRRDAVGEAVIAHKTTVHYVANIDRIADGPVNGESSVAYRPEKKTFETGVEAHVRGRKLDQGVLAQVALADTRVLALHTVEVHETITQPVVNDTWKAAFELAFGPVSTRVTQSKGIYGFAFQIPDCPDRDRGGMADPDRGILVVSLGVEHGGRRSGPRRRPRAAGRPGSPPRRRPIADRDLDLERPTRPRCGHGRDDSSRRAALRRSSGGSEVRRGGRRELRGSPGRTDHADPSAPSRMLPLPIDAEGHVVELPPLPIAESTIDDAIKPAANQPSPQSIHLSAIDPSVSQASFSAPAPGVTTNIVPTSGPSLGLGLQMKDGRDAGPGDRERPDRSPQDPRQDRDGPGSARRQPVAGDQGDRGPRLARRRWRHRHPPGRWGQPSLRPSAGSFTHPPSAVYLGRPRGRPGHREGDVSWWTDIRRILRRPR